MPDLLRVFLDANVLFSAALKQTSRLRQFWQIRNAILMTSIYVADEARRNCVNADHLARLEALLEQTHFVSDAPHPTLPGRINLPAKDAPVLAAAMQAGADYLITGDRRHFRPWMNTPIQTSVGMLIIQEPTFFLDGHMERLE